MRTARTALWYFNTQWWAVGNSYTLVRGALTGKQGPAELLSHAGADTARWCDILYPKRMYELAHRQRSQ
jgi:hypothetical protein